MKITSREAVAGNVRATAARQRVRQMELAKALGITQPAMSRRLNGEVEFSVSELQAAADHLGVPVTALLTAPEDAEHEPTAAVGT